MKLKAKEIYLDTLMRENCKRYGMNWNMILKIRQKS